MALCSWLIWAKGNSGSPVFDCHDSRVIGVHVLGGRLVNSASVVGGHDGNRFQAIYDIVQDLDGTNAADADQPDASKWPWLYRRYATTTESEVDTVRMALQDTRNQAKSVVSAIPGTILDADTPIGFGEDAGPQLGILASAALATAISLAADSTNKASVESLVETRPYDGILSALGPVVAGIRPFVVKFGPKVLSGVLEPCMRILLSTLKKESELDKKSKRLDELNETQEKDPGCGRQLTEQEDYFIKSLLDEAKSEEIGSFQNTLTTIGEVVGSAFNKAGPILVDLAKLAVPLLVGTEADVAPSQARLEPLVHRAILAEACLQAFVANPKSNMFKKMIKTLTKLGPKLVNVAPFVVKLVGPIVADLLGEIDRQKVKQEFLDFTYGK